MPSPTGPLRVVKRRLADGTVKEYTYARDKKTKVAKHDAGSVYALIRAYERSPQWAILRPETHRSYRRFLSHLEAIGHRLVKEVRRKDLLALADIIATSHGRASANVFVRVCGAIFAWAVDRDWITQTPVFQIQALPAGHLLAWSETDADLACRHLPEPLRRVVVVARYTAQRRSDLVAMRWGAYDGDSIRVIQEKTGAEIYVPIHPELRAELEAWRAQVTPLPNVHILRSLTGLPWTASNLSHALDRELARIPGLRPSLNVHGLRKLAAASLAEAGCTTHEIAAITGHKSLAMVELYTASSEQRRLGRAAMGKLARAGKFKKPVIRQR